jgi:hypothetical protein
MLKVVGQFHICSLGYQLEDARTNHKVNTTQHTLQQRVPFVTDSASKFEIYI